MEKTELRPCPFCGSDDLAAVKVVTPNENKWYISCRLCLTNGPFETTRDRAIEMWNLRRPFDQRTEILRQAIDELLDDVQPLGEYRCGLCGKRECSH